MTGKVVLPVIIRGLLLLFLLITFGTTLVFSDETDIDTPAEPGLKQEMTRTGSDSLQSPSSCGDQPLVSDQTILQEPEMSESAPRIPFCDAVFGTSLVRVTDRNSDIEADDESEGIKNEYSRVQSFNADESMFLLRGVQATWYLYDAVTLRPLKELPDSIEAEPRWDTSDPMTFYYIECPRLMKYDVGSDTTSLQHDFSSDFPGEDMSCVWTRYEGSQSKDGNYWGFMVTNSEWEATAFLIYDLAEDRIIAKRTENIPKDIDSVTISPSGKYFLAYSDQNCEWEKPGDDTHPCGLMVYDQTLGNGRSLLRTVGHSDTAIDNNGRDVLVYQDIDTDMISMLDLESGDITPLIPIDFSHTEIGLHFSGRAFNKPGWAVISTYNGGYPEDLTWLDDQVFALEMKENGRMYRLAHHHSVYNPDIEKDYWAEPHATSNRDMTKILFTSNWGRSGTEKVETYMITLPPGFP